jgi:ADP-ribosylglycohydrolase
MDSFYQAALVADSLCLGPHWIYDQEEIAEAFPKGIQTFEAPVAEYHKGKMAGDLTHYGDQTVMLKHSLKKRDGFDAEGWRKDWVAAMGDYKGYVDGASKETLKGEAKSPSDSEDLGGAARIAPILDLYLSLGDAIDAVRAQTKLTHGDPAVADAAEFFTRAVHSVTDGAAFEDALAAAADGGIYRKLEVEDHLEKALKFRDDSFHKVARKFGQACGVESAFPLALYFLLRPETDFATTISDNAMAGGDSSARGMLIALLYAAENREVAASLVGGLRAL